eukprot:CAMPEP_0171703090 /NCGR_PEP_ID=MMETSP0991-20121206/11949_1 /TAXON_ID=483369 /ORGANISM="non described non described, Strain CCMP2098" /LENGTH=832 /DNA_ID=CAMNT_0012292487 /DNA_START=523 /DNA_END=3021 /DNA_ORIENTATION=-
MEMVILRSFDGKRLLSAVMMSFLLVLSAFGVHAENGRTSLQFITVLKIFKASRIVKINTTADDSNDNDLAAEISNLTLKLCGIIFVATGVVLEVSTIRPETFDTGHASAVPMGWHTAFYFIIITLSTVGYGDVVPTAVSTKLGVAAFILFCLYYIPEQIGRIADISRSRQLNRNRYNGANHILICGHLRPIAVKRFLFEYFHADRSNEWKHCVILCADKSSESELAHISRASQWKNNVKFIFGDPTDDSDLCRAKAHLATHVYIMCKPSEDHSAEETYLVCAAISIRNHCLRNPNVLDVSLLPKLVAETNSREGAKALAQVGVDIPLVSSRVKAAILSFGTAVPGFIPLFVNLITPSRGNSADRAPRTWTEQYLYGTEYEVYCVPVKCNQKGSVDSRRLRSKQWAELCLAVYNHGSAVLLGVAQWSLHSHCQDDPSLLGSRRPLKERSFEEAKDDCSEEGDTCLPMLNPGPLFNGEKCKTLYVIATCSDDAIATINAALDDVDKIKQRDQGETSELFIEASVGSADRAESEEESNNKVVILLHEEPNLGDVALFVVKLTAVDRRSIVVVHPRVSVFNTLQNLALELTQERGLNAPILEHYEGSPRSQADLKQAGVLEASSVTVFANGSLDQVDTESAPYAAYGDRETIMISSALVSASNGTERDLPVSYELVNDNSTAFLRQCLSDERYCPEKRPSSIFLWPMFCAGRVYAHSIHDTLLVPLSINEEEAGVWSALFALTTKEFSLKPVPSGFRNYGELFRSMCARGDLVVGLYRPVHTLGSTLPFTVTNPEASTTLVPNDQMFLIKSADPAADHGLAGKDLKGHRQHSGSWY